MCGAVLENVVFEEHYRDVDYSDKSVTGKGLDVQATSGPEIAI